MYIYIYVLLTFKIDAVSHNLRHHLSNSSLKNNRKKQETGTGRENERESEGHVEIFIFASALVQKYFEGSSTKKCCKEKNRYCRKDHSKSGKFRGIKYFSPSVKIYSVHSQKQGGEEGKLNQWEEISRIHF